MRRYFWNLLIWLTQTLNVFTGGDPDETLSSRAGKARRRGSWFGTLLANVIDKIFSYLGDDNHCEKSIEPDEGKREVLGI